MQCIIPSCDRTDIANKGKRGATTYQGLCGPCHKYFERRKQTQTFEQSFEEREKRMRQITSMPDTCIVPACENLLTVYIKNTHNMCEGCNANWIKHSEKGGNLEDFLSYRSNFKQAPEYWKNSPYPILPKEKQCGKGEKAVCVACNRNTRIANKSRKLCTNCSNKQIYLGENCECCGETCTGQMNYHWNQKHQSLVCHNCHARLGNYKITIKKLQELDAITNCDICNKQLTKEKGPHGRAIDHDHQTGKVRGILCMSCNMIEGQMKNIPITPPEYGSNLEAYLTR